MKKSYIKFWGVRGSNPTADKDKMLFGGDTSCVEVRTANDEIIIFDMGSGIRNLGKEIIQDSNSPKTINIFLSHFHFDHVMGFLVFPPLFDSSFTINIYGFNKSTSTKSFSDKILDSTFWPVGLDVMQAKINFIDLDGDPLKISEQTSVSYALHPHPGYATSYKLDTNGYSILYTTDCEHPKNHFNKNVETLAQNADVDEEHRRQRSVH
jgi:phosphoribosyl 1,2-cyclic phosphodiesterase